MRLSLFIKALCIVLFFTTALCAQKSIKLTSPDQKIAVQIEVDKTVLYSVSVDDKKGIEPSDIDMQLADGRRLSGAAIASVKTRLVNKIITAQVPVSRRIIPDQYNETIISFKNRFSLIFRAYNDGVAYRITTSFQDSIIINNETALFRFSPDAHAWAPVIHKRADQDIYHTSFEETYPYVSLDSLADSSYMFTPVLVRTNSNIKVSVTESDLEDYPGMFLHGTSGNQLASSFAPYPLAERVAEGDYPQKVVTQRASFIAKTKGSRDFPWRVMMIAREDKDLPANDLVYRLASPSRIPDVSWIRPGKGTDEWIIDVNLFNVPFRSGVNTASYKYYIDFAKRFGFTRIMMDAGWSNPRDLFAINPAINMDSISLYAKQQGIKLSMWTLSMTLDRQLDSALQQFQKWGVDFIMTDFIDRDDQPTVRFYKRIAEACAKAHLMIMFHGAYPAKGFNRTYPNNVSREGVLGSEYNAWSDKVTASHNCILPFTRMPAGPMDYEPGLLDNATPQQFRPIWGKVMSQTTRCQQLAMFVVYDDPLPIFSGNPSQGYLEPQFMELLGNLPSGWDTTIVLDAQVGKYIVTARRKDKDWYIGGMTDSSTRDLSIPLTFLSGKSYSATICTDGINADRNAMDYRIEQKKAMSREILKIHVAPNGGFLVKLKEE